MKRVDPDTDKHKAIYLNNYGGTTMSAQYRFGRAALRAAIIGLAAAALAPVLATTANAADTDARDLDWKNATLDLIETDQCPPAGPVKFTDGTAQIDLGEGQKVDLYQWPVQFGDVNRDGRQDALFGVSCFPRHGLTRTTLYAFGVKDGAPARIGVVTTPIVELDTYRASGGTVTVTARPDRQPETEALTFKLRWNGTGFVERSGKGVYLHNWGAESLAMPFKGESVPLKDAKPCPRTTVDFDDHSSFGRYGEKGTDDGFLYAIQASKFGDVNRDGVADALVTLTCFVRDNPGSMVQGVYAYTVKNGKPVPLSYLTTTTGIDGWTGIGNVRVTKGQVALVQHPGTSDISVERTFRWTKGGLKADKPLPGFPKVDVAL